MGGCQLKSNKRMIILLLITAILAIANFAGVMYKSYITHKIPGFYPKNKWETEKLHKRGKRQPPKVTIKKIEEPGVWYLLVDMECTYTKMRKIDFLKDVALESTIPAGELLNEIDQITVSRENTWYHLKKKSDGRSVIIPKNRFGKNKSLRRKSGLSDRFDDLNTEEILISMHYDYQQRRNFVGSLKSFDERIATIRDNLENEHAYKIFINPKSSLKGSIFQIKGKDLQALLGFNALPYNSDERASLLAAIANNDEIPFELKSRIIVGYIHSFFSTKLTNSQKEEFCDYLIKMIEENSGKSISNDDQYPSEIDQYVVLKTMVELNRFRSFSHVEFLELCDRIIAAAKNPETILRAYAAKTYSMLKQDDFDSAHKLALKSLKLYRKQFFDRPIDGILNGQAALFCLKYELDENLPLTVILEHLDMYYKKSSHFPDFRNNLLFIKAVITDITDSPVKEVIKAYEKVAYNSGGGYSGYNYIQSMTKIRNAPFAINFLKSQMEVNITIDKPIKTKKYLRSKDSQIMNKSGSMKITIIQHGLPEIASKIARTPATKWKKASIDGDIYWFTTDLWN